MTNSLFPSADSISNYVSTKALFALSIITVIILTCMIVANVLVWAIPPKSKKKALKNLNGDKRLYNKIWIKSGYFVAFCIISLNAIICVFTNYISVFVLTPYVFDFYGNFGTELNSALLLFSVITMYIELIIAYIISVSLKLKADRSALSKSSHTHIVRKFRNSMNKKK